MPEDPAAPGWVVDPVLGIRGILSETRRQGPFIALVVGPKGRPRAWSVIVGLTTGEKLFQASDLHDQQAAEDLALAQMAALAQGVKKQGRHRHA
jgi:hypothetical protein